MSNGFGVEDGTGVGDAPPPLQSRVPVTWAPDALIYVMSLQTCVCPAMIIGSEFVAVFATSDSVPTAVVLAIAVASLSPRPNPSGKEKVAVSADVTVTGALMEPVLAVNSKRTPESPVKF